MTLLDLKTLFLKALPIVCSKTRVIIVLDDMDATSTGSVRLQPVGSACHVVLSAVR